MGSEIVYCDSCGERILEKEIQQGKALTIQNKNYCSNCKEQAITDHSGEMSRDEFAKTVLPKEDPPPQEKNGNSTTSHMRAVRPDNRIVSRAGQPTRRHFPTGPSTRIHGRGAERDKVAGREKGAGRYGRPIHSSSNSSSTIWIIVGVAAVILIIILMLATRKQT